MRTRLALYVWALDPARTLTAPATPWSEPRRSRGPNGTSPFGSAGRGRAPLSRFGGNATTVRRSRAAPHGLGGLKDVGGRRTCGGRFEPTSVPRTWVRCVLSLRQLRTAAPCRSERRPNRPRAAECDPAGRIRASCTAVHDARILPAGSHSAARGRLEES